MSDPFTFLKLDAFSIGIKKNRNALGDTQKLLRDVTRLRAASPLADFDDVEFASGILQEVIRRADIAPPYDVAFAVMEFISEMAQHQALIEVDESILSYAPDSREAVEIREYLRQQMRFVENYDQCMPVLTEHLTLAAHYLINQTPAFALNAEADQAFLSVPMEDVMHAPAQVVQMILGSTCDDELERWSLLDGVAKRMEQNLLRVSKVDPYRPPTNPHRYTYPEDTVGWSGQELVDEYLVGTPYRHFFKTSVPVVINEESRFEHCHILAGTGHGKTQFLQKWIAHDLELAVSEKRSVVVIDSQGDMIRKISSLACFDPEQGELADRLVIIDPNDVLFPAAINMFALNEKRLASYGPVEREKVQNAAIALYEHFFGELLGAELTSKQGVVFKYLARLMLEIPNATILTLRDLMDDPKPFIPYMDKLEGSARVFFAREFLDKSFNQTKQQISKRLWAVLSTPAFERLFSSTENKIDLFECMNEGKIILINTAKDLLKQEGASLYGRFFLSMIAQAIMERAAIPENKRTPTFLYVDECQDYFDETIETLLAQGRKYRIGLHLSHQTTQQLNSHERASVLANCNIKACGGINASDAKLLAQEMHVSSDYLQSMKKSGSETEFAFWMRHDLPQTVKLTVPFGHMESLPRLNREQYAKLLEQNRRRYCWEYRPEESQSRITFPGMGEATKEALPKAEQPNDPPPLLQEPVPQEASVGGGRGGKQHRQIQSMVRSLANQHGWRADIEYPVADGAVDVWLQRDGQSIACEITVTTPTEYEVHNIEKSLAAGADEVWVISEDRAKLYEIEQMITANERISFMTPDDIPTVIEQASGEEPVPSTSINGYSVAVRRAFASYAEKAARREMLNQALKNLR